MLCNTVLFDLDGTLTDPGLGITNSVIYALKKFGLTPPDRRALYPFIGPPLLDSFMKYFGFSQEQGRTAISYYREYFSDKGLFENAVYPGAHDMLAELTRSGFKLGVATSKPEPFSKRILDHFDLSKYFDFIAGADMDGARTKKGDVIAYALAKYSLGIDCIMVGDREHDIFGARENGLDSIGVLYGYGSLDELKNAGATHIAATPAEIAKILEA